MPQRLLRAIPKRFRLPLGMLAVLLAYLPVFSFGSFELLYSWPALVVTSGCVMLSRRHTVAVIAWSIGISVVITVGGFVRPTTDALPFGQLASFIVANILLGLVHYWIYRSQSGPYEAQTRLTWQLKQQSLELQEALQSHQYATEQVEQRAVHDRRALLEHLPAHVVQKDQEGRFTFVSQSFCQLVNRDFADIIGKTDYDLFPDDLASKFVRDDQEVMQSHEVLDVVEESRSSAGDSTFMRVRKAAMRDPAGNVVGVQGIFWDVTKEKLGQQELERTESRAHALISAALDAVLIVDSAGDVLDANPASEKILGYTRDQVNSHPPIGEIMQTGVIEPGGRHSDPAEAKQLFQRRTEIADVLKSARNTRIEARLRRQDGEWFDAEISAHPLNIKKSKGWAIFIRDITARKRAEQELRSAKEIAEQANATKSEFVANVSHELRTPLTGIVGLHELLADSELNERQLDYLQLARLSASNLMTLIDDLLDFSKIESGLIEIEAHDFDLVTTIEDAVHSLAARAQLKGLEIMVQLPAQLPGNLLGDPHRVRQVIVNLVGNAIKFTDKGDVRVALILHNHPSQDLVAVRIEVHDSGIGVTPEQREVIFDAFRQADSSTTRRFGGTGLGLTICRDLVGKMQGTIGVTTATTIDGQTCAGSCFFFELPLQRAGGTPELKPQAVTGTGPQVVLAASNAPWRILLQQELIRMGYTLHVMTVRQLIDKEKLDLFAAGNNTIVIADSSELTALPGKHAPVVVKWILLNRLVEMHTRSTPRWLRHADVCWLPRPIRRSELAAALEVKPESIETTTATEEAKREKSARTARVLLVEDSVINQTILKDMLVGLGHAVVVAGSGAEAIQACSETRFDIVLMDIQMPGTDGLDATREIRRSEVDGRPRQLICALTAHATTNDRQQCGDAGMDMFLVKPILLDSLASAVQQAVGGKKDADMWLSEIEAAAIQEGEGCDTSEGIEALDVSTALDSSPAWAQLIEKMHNNESLLRDVLALLSTEVCSLAQNFRAAVQDKDVKGARRAIHTLKSNLRQIGLTVAAEYSQQLENVARDGQLELLSDHVEPIVEMAEKVADWADEQLALHRGS